MKILSEFPDVLNQVSYEVGKQKTQFRLSAESPVDNPALTIGSFNKQFQLNAQEKDAVTASAGGRQGAWRRAGGYQQPVVVDAIAVFQQYRLLLRVYVIYPGRGSDNGPWWQLRSIAADFLC